MPLLGGACKMAGAPAAAGDPRFVGDPYTAFAYYVRGVFPRKTVIAGFEIDADGAIEKFTSEDGNLGDVGRWDNSLGTLNKIDYQFRFDSNETPHDTSDLFNTWLPARAGLDNFSISIDTDGEKSTNPPGGTVRVRLATSPFTEFDMATMNMTVGQEP